MKLDLLKIIGKMLHYLHARLVAPLAAAGADHSYPLCLLEALDEDKLVAEVHRGDGRQTAPGEVSSHPVLTPPQIFEPAVQNGFRSHVTERCQSILVIGCYLL